MKNLFFILLAALLITSCHSKSIVSNGSPADFKISRGTNIAHWLSQSDRLGAERDSFFQEKDIIAIKNLGFDHIRLPIDEVQMWGDNGTRYEDAFKLMTNCIDWCRNHQLKVIVDLHILRSHNFNALVRPLWTDPKEQEKFYKLWADLSSELIKYPVSDVAYELLNEPVADDQKQWNNLLAHTIKTLRALEPDRIIVIGSNMWESAKTFNVLKVPEDKNIIFSFHFFEPFLLTHYDANRSELKNYTGPVHYPGELLTKAEFDSISPVQQAIAKDFTGDKWNIEKLEKIMKIPIQKAKELGLQLYCGEFGVVENAPEADKIRWFNDMTTVFNRFGIASANWNYKSDQFGLIKDDGSKREIIIQAILKK